MIRHLAAAALAALPAASAAALSLTPPEPTNIVVTRGSVSGPVLYAAPDPAPGQTAEAARCYAPGERAQIYFTLNDPQGIDYAGIDIRADAVRPVVSDHVATYLWVAPGTRADRAYRWRFEPEGPRYPQTHTIPIAIRVLPSEGPLDIHVETKDAAGNLGILDFQLSAAAVLCR